MLDDRPEMRGLFDDDSPLFQWLSSKFEGATVESRMYWNAEEPPAGFSASHMRRYSMYPAQVYVSSSNHLSGLDKWVALVFETHNLQNAGDFAKLEADAANGKLLREEFVVECVSLEVDAMLETERLLKEKVDQKILDSCMMYAEIQRTVRQRKEGKEVDTGSRHRDYYRAVYSHIMSWTRNPGGK